MYSDSFRTLERKFGQPQEEVSAHLDKLNSYPTLKMQNGKITINYSECISGIVEVFILLSYNSDLKSAALLITDVQKLPPNNVGMLNWVSQSREIINVGSDINDVKSMKEA